MCINLYLTYHNTREIREKIVFEREYNVSYGQIHIKNQTLL